MAEFGEAVVGACSSAWKEVAEERGGAVRGGLAAERVIRHTAQFALQPQ